METVLATKTANSTLTATDSVILANTSSGPITVTLSKVVAITRRQSTINRLNDGSIAVTIACSGD